MISDKDRIDFLQSLCDPNDQGKSYNLVLGKGEDIREALDRDMHEILGASLPTIYCECGTGFAEEDMDGPDGVAPCISSTPQKWNPGSQSHTWTSTYECPVCAQTFDVGESD